MANYQSQATDVFLEAPVLTSGVILAHWQGHRRLTRHVIGAFPEDAFFHYSIGGMRPFSRIVAELTALAQLGIRGIVSGEWTALENTPVLETKSEVLQQWDEVTESLNSLWPQISPLRFEQKEMAFGMYEGSVCSHILYFIDNEIHHRGQGYVYLRSLGIEPPPFWQRD